MRLHDDSEQHTLSTKRNIDLIVENEQENQGH